MSHEPVHIRIEGSFKLERANSSRTLTAAQVIAGTFTGPIVVESTRYHDRWHVSEAVIFGVGGPTDYDRHVDGKYRLSFVPQSAMREIVEGEEFRQVHDNTLC